ncbi:hypothetical protein BJY01DRAFT_249048 [Aspergillus pseudoustus]|uniref:Uncharacterized protein n=1 Tax=Aspergillus pseudoustus TaxID=1810923 RepID=A0ABR4JUD3_9EURO
MINCTFYLIGLAPGTTPRGFSSNLMKGALYLEILVAGIPHGWVHKPLHQDAARLTTHTWDVFIVTKTSQTSLIASIDGSITAYITANFMMPQHQYERLVSERSNKCAGNHSSHPVQLPAEWTDPNTNALHIPRDHITEAYSGPATAGILRLQPTMVDFLSTALPSEVRDRPVILFNLFLYTDGDSAIHDEYMRDFEEGFGDSAGAYVKFMGPVVSQLRGGQDSAGQGEGDSQSESSLNGPGWQDVDLVHYDTIYHYAYMLSTELYQGLNKAKVRGLEDTCILLVSEDELQ